MRVAFWNVGGMAPGSDKEAVARAWFTWAVPDLMFLEEVNARQDPLQVSAGVAATYQTSGVEVLNSDGGESTKNLAFVIRQGLLRSDPPFVRRMPGQRAVAMTRQAQGFKASSPQRRDCVRVEVNIGGELHEIWGLHANASYSGGLSAAACMSKFIQDHNEFSLVVAGGDFNTESENLGDLVRKVVPIDHAGQPLTFTQWDKVLKEQMYTPGTRNFDADAYGRYLASVHLPPNHQGQRDWTKAVKKNKLIDYVLTSHGVNAVALRNCESADQWFTVLREFDHAPVLYNIT